MTIRFQVAGMTCAACSARVEKVTAAVPGVNKAEVNLLRGTLVVDAVDASVTDQILRAVTAAGYQPSLPGEAETKNRTEEDPLKEMKKRILVSALFLLTLMYFTMGHMLSLPLPNW